jgi:hypothetical protein
LVGARKAAPAQKEGNAASRDFRGIAGDAAHDLNAVAAELGYTFESAKRTLERNAADAASDTAAYVKGKPSIEVAIKAAQMEAVTLGDSTLFGQLHRYSELRKAIVLPEAGLSLDQARAAALLSTTYGNAQNRLQTLGLKTLPQDYLVADARRLGAAFYRQTRKKPARSGSQRNEAMRKTAARAKGKPQIEAAIKAAQTEAVASGNSTLFGRLHRYAEMRKTIALPKTGLTLEQARAAALLFSTYRNAQDQLQTLGLKLLPQDQLVADARRLAASFYRQLRKKPARSGS